ncbi:substrate-binding domain-containing protein [Parasulfitobacter algicola]|uniref:Substrate-binding domain-containing protein n=1 Tax=Parasulfitobacter algicola TaxID=2614809 RepID=A0ABX2INF1_9RHOB|nr:phosphate ABC transporter substrate-binding/OmpA family protein [Sulfitobacter algicola]NSX54075.1 substrate-binding domain-containing protein [Sulfitobacter algicola]
MRGDLKAVREDVFILATTIGDVQIPRSAVMCIGDSCPKIDKPQADIVIRGSDTVGDELMPLLIEGYANSLQAATANRREVGADTVSLSIRDNFGDGEEIWIAEVQAAGSSTGFRALIDGQADIAMSSRPVRSIEAQAIVSQGRGDLLNINQEYVVAVDSILTIVSPQNPINELSMTQLADLFAGRIRNWSLVGGPDIPVTVFTRAPTSGTRGVFQTQILEPKGLQMASNAVVLTSNQEMSNAVATTIGGIGYVGFASKRGAKAVDLIADCGIKMSATPFASKTEEYPLERRLRLYVDNKQLTETTKGLLDFAISSEADGLIQKAGFVDLSVKVDPDFGASRIIQAAQQLDEASALQTMRDMMINLSGVQRLSTTFRFESGSASLDNKSVRDLKRVIEFIAKPENRNKEIILVGFTDNFGSFTANAELSKARAAVVREALLLHRDAASLQGVTIRATGYGELSPVGCNDTDQGRKRNRRVEVWMK